MTDDAHATRSRGTSPGPGQGIPAQSAGAPGGETSTEHSVSGVLRAAGYKASSHDRHAAYGPEGYQFQAAPDGGLLIRHAAMAETINGVTPWDRVMLTRYARALRAAGFHVTNPAPGSLAVTPQPADRQAPQVPAPAKHEQGKRMQALHVAVAANEAYRAGDLDRAQQLVDQAADLDPAHADLWQRHRSEVTAKRLFAQAKAASAEGDHGRAHNLVEDARQLDPRMQMLWNRHLSGMRGGQRARAARDRSAPGNDREPASHASQPAREHAASQETSPPGGPTLRRRSNTSGPARTYPEPQPVTGPDLHTSASAGTRQPRLKTASRGPRQAHRDDAASRRPAPADDVPLDAATDKLVAAGPQHPGRRQAGGASARPDDPCEPYWRKAQVLSAAPIAQAQIQASQARQAEAEPEAGS